MTTTMRIAIAALFVICGARSSAAAPAEANDEVVRRALADEMARSMKDLEIPNEPRPHRIVYFVTDSEQVTAAATFGAGTGATPRRWRTLRVEVRVGDRTFDSGNFTDAAFDFPTPAPLEDDYLALRRELWLRTDEAFKRAVDAIGKKRAAEKAQAKGDDEAPFDFAEAKPVEAPPSGGAEEKPDAEALAQIVKELSAVFREFPGIHNSGVSGEHVTIRHRMLASDGSWKDERRSVVEIAVNAATQADDGMGLRTWRTFQGVNLQSLPPRGGMITSVKAMAADLTAARKAPIGDDGTAVVVFEGRAAGQLLRRLLGDQLSGTPAPKSSGGRGGAVAASELASKLGQKVAPPFLDVHDDPREALGPGQVALFGAYQVDDEGVPAERVSLVERGVLKSLLMSRTPRKEILRSNGHGRGRPVAGAVRARSGVLFVSAGKAGLADAPLRARALKEAKAAGDNTALYIVRAIDATADGIRPLVVTRLRDGKEEPVRGITFTNLQPRALKDIVAVGKDPTVYNYLLGGDGPFHAGGSPGTIVTPSVVFKDVEIKKDTGKNPRPPVYPHPHFAEK